MAETELPPIEDDPVAIRLGLTGPYDPDTNGRCANGHPLNGKGRCQPLNDTGTCQPDPAP